MRRIMIGHLEEKIKKELKKPAEKLKK